MNLEIFLESTNPANVYVGEEDGADGDTGWLLPLLTYTTEQRDGMPKLTPPPLDPKLLTVWAAQLRVVAQTLDDLAQEMQPAVCFPSMGMEGSNGL